MSQAELAAAMPLVTAAVLLAALLLATVFHRGRAGLAVLVLAWMHLVLGGAAPIGLAPASGQGLETALILMPWALLLVVLLAETPVISWRGGLLLAVLAGFSLIAVMLPASLWDRLWALQRWPAGLTRPLLPDTPWLAPGLSVWVAVLGMALAGWRGWRQGDPVALGLMASLLLAAVLPTLVLLGVSPWPGLLAAGLALLFAIGYAAYRMAFLDALTGLPGRRMLDEHMARLGRRHAIAMLDVDHFKAFNDRYGHEVGDQVLKLVASMLRRHFGGRAYRYGGEEFTVLFPGRARRRAEARLEAFREAMAARELRLRAADRPARGGRGSRGKSGKGGEAGREAVSVTLSIGLAERGPEWSTAPAVREAADQALYAAKKAGRNCLLVAGRKPIRGTKPRGSTPRGSKAAGKAAAGKGG